MARALLGALLALVSLLVGPRRAEADDGSRFWDLPADLIRTLANSPQIMVKRTPSGWDAYCRCPVVLRASEIPAAVKKAIVAVEDKRYLDRDGAVDLLALLAVARDGFNRGASTIPMQLLKNLVLHDLRDAGLMTKVERKGSELLFANSLHGALRKDELLAAYLNQVEFDGREIVGLYRAARHYFRKEPRDLNLFEAAMLAGMVQAPHRFNPLRPAGEELAHKRARHVLDLMVAQRLISDRERRRAEEIGVRPGIMPEFKIHAQPFVEWVTQTFGPDLVQPGETVRFFATIDPFQQRLAELRMADLVAEGSIPPEYEAASVVMTGDGRVRAMIGATDWQKSQFNRAVKAEVQPGSTAKLALVIAACEAGRGPDSRVLDLPVEDGWPSNGALGYAGAMSFRDAIAQSRNAAAVRLADEIGPERVAAAARRLGLDPGPNPDLGLPLGPFKTDPLRMTAAYAAVANGGERVAPTGVLAAVDGRGRVLGTYANLQKSRAIGPKCVAQARAMLGEVVRSGTGRAARLARWPSFGKTGTSTGNADAWFIGWSQGHVIGTWMGKRRDAPGPALAGGGPPAEYFKRVATDLIERDESRARARQRAPVVAGGPRPIARSGPVAHPRQAPRTADARSSARAKAQGATPRSTNPRIDPRQPGRAVVNL